MSAHPPSEHQAWKDLERFAPEQRHLRELAHEPGRGERFGVQAAGLSLDFSRQRFSQPVLTQLLALAHQSQVPGQRTAMFRGDHINATENRPVLHTALRGQPDQVGAWGQAVHDQIQTQLSRFCAFAQSVRDGQIKGYGGLPVTDVIHIGIGGSDLGPKMAAHALSPYASQHLRVHFISNPDAWNVYALLQTLDASKTLVIVSSKTFTTQETLTNAQTVREWLTAQGCPPERLAQQLVAVTASPEQALRLGYLPDQTFTFWDWVGGRYSVWSAIGLPLAIAIGEQNFRAFLAGAHAMDTHFCHAPLEKNLPVLMALIGVWNRNFLRIPSLVIASYATRLSYFVPFIQQMDMESNGKRTHTNGRHCAIDTGPIVWGGLGIDGQHAYFQLLHQGKHPVCLEFIGVKTEDTPMPRAREHHRVVQANLLAQAESLALGRNDADTRAELLASGMSPAAVQAMAAHRTFDGNVPSSIVWMERLDPFHLGALIAAYEHKVFVQACIWDIHAFDQWGVELGKKVGQKIYGDLAP
jgi:glucose-6-phosphate isomerase